MAQAGLVNQINAGIGRYYVKQGVDGYFNDAKKYGKFKKYCKESGFEDGDIPDELEQDPADSQLVDFDTDSFPAPDGSGKTASAKQILDVIQQCVNDPNAFAGYAPLAVSPEDWKVSAQQIKQVKGLYKEQFQTLFNAGMAKDHCILHMLALERKLPNKNPFLLYLADVFTREFIRITNDPNDPRHGTNYDVGVFATTNRYFTKQLANHTVQSKGPKGEIKAMKLSDLAKSAIDSFLARICPKIMLTPAFKFKASLEQTCRSIANAVAFVKNRASNKELTCPFQFDLSFSFGDAAPTDNKVDFEESDDDDDDDDDDDEKKEEKVVFEDAFGDIAGKLKSAGLYSSTSQDRNFGVSFKAFENEMRKKHKDYPHRRRFCGIVDDRNLKADEKGDLILFEPPSNCSSFPEHEQGHLQLWYFDAARTAILPEKALVVHKRPSDDTSDDEEEEKPKVARQKSFNAVNKNAMTLSFHVESEDEIRCYLFVQTMCMRFMPEDIIDVLPTFFDSGFRDNAAWTKGDSPSGKVAKDLVKVMKTQLTDPRFDAFYKMCTTC